MPAAVHLKEFYRVQQDGTVEGVVCEAIPSNSGRHFYKPFVHIRNENIIKQRIKRIERIEASLTVSIHGNPFNPFNPLSFLFLRAFLLFVQHFLAVDDVDAARQFAIRPFTICDFLSGDIVG